ncbi:MAG: fused DSP-PTPase phosphatase/NAD kinase-like protein [Acidimicrobiia bacterium]
MSRAISLGLPLSGSLSWRAGDRSAVRAAIGPGAFLVVGNLFIQGASLVARATVETGRVSGVEHVAKLRGVDDTVSRGALPSRVRYRELAEAGVTVTVDLRAEDDAPEDDAYVEGLGIEVVHLPVRDGQTPSPDDVARFLTVVRDSDGRVFVHCGAGVGRTGAMVAAYLVATDQAGRRSVVSRNLAVGPPSLEQIVYAAGGGEEPNVVVKALSRTLDAPRRIWHIL